MIKTRSIKRNLINSISAVFGLFIIIVYTFIDTSIDNWAQQQFKTGLKEQMEQIKVLIHDHASPIVDNKNSHFYYQIWKNNQTIKRSVNLRPYPELDLHHTKIAINSNQLVQVTMPNNAPGQALLSSYVHRNKDGSSDYMYITVATSTKSLTRITGLLDILLIGSFLLSMIIIRIVTKKIVSQGLLPLDSLNHQIKTFNNNNDDSNKHFIFDGDKNYSEIDLIINELNNFLAINRNSIENEKRITSDIAHEIKTPISELITLTEVHQRFPDDKRLAETFTDDILQISNRMRIIVENLLLLQRTSSAIELYKQPLDLMILFNDIERELVFKYPDISTRITNNTPLNTTVIADTFSLKTILTNLIDNALFYSLSTTNIQINVVDKTSNFIIEVINTTTVHYSETELKKLVQPLYQYDCSRSNDSRYGLGLSIVNNICKVNQYQLTISQTIKGDFSVKVCIPK
ncbi:sensor histidine kinase [Photobacterium andalusiense]|uniref:histidine kinase n=1 Tax=Photobacterium andalusiense TaxID=2204296 RepID=A0A1Y6MAE5_9GAMM|nr:HAMP domain-containing sensor histidine kinase [Photobacterium andalusiense]SMY32889.1 putative sensor histidine kinase TcrY [Photobacterium andalusiense]